MLGPDDHLPLSDLEFAQLMESFLGLAEGRLALAVSGGPDSMALAVCAGRWARERHLPPPVALIVDHRLRKESEAEAATVRDRLHALGLFAEILVWEHPPLSSRIHVLARRARYDLLRAACARHGAEALALAHHRDDQAETVLARLAKGSGTDGLAGMDPDTQQEGLRLIRPFLSLPKARLVATCDAAGVAYVQDPSNVSPRYARGRLRQVQELLATEGLTAARLVDLADRAREDRAALAFYAQRFIEAHLNLDSDGVVRIARAPFAALPAAIAARVLRQGLHVIHRKPHPHPREALMPLCAKLTGASEVAAHSLGGCLVAATERTISILREYAGITERVAIAPGTSVLWDGRWEVSLDRWGDKGLEVRALGPCPASVLDELAPGLRHARPQGRLRAVLPALWRENKLVGVPTFAFWTPEKNSLPAIAKQPTRPIS